MGESDYLRSALTTTLPQAHNDISYHAERAGIQLVNKGLVHSIFITCITRVCYQQMPHSQTGQFCTSLAMLVSHNKIPKINKVGENQHL
jgi:hypothetical protein